MKKVFIALVLGLSLILIAAHQSKAQVNVNINIGAQPLWFPVGYTNANYFYAQPASNVYFKNYKVKHVKHKHYSVRQPIVRYNTSPRYYVVKGHPHGMPPGQAKKYYSSKGWEKYKSHGHKHKGGKKH